MSDNLSEKIAELRSLADKATPRPWAVGEWDDEPCLKYAVEDLNGWQYWTPQNSYWLNGSTEGDATYIVAACNLAPALIERIEAQSTRLSEVFEANESLINNNASLTAALAERDADLARWRSGETFSARAAEIYEQQRAEIKLLRDAITQCLDMLANYSEGDWMERSIHVILHDAINPPTEPQS